MELETERLRLRLMSPEDITGLLDGIPVEGVPWGPGYPLDGTLVAAGMQSRLHDAGEAIGSFGQFQIVRKLDGVVIGDVGFHAPPDEVGDVSVGFGIVPTARGEGYATEALQGLLAWALEQPEVRTVHADTDLVNIASQQVLAAAGMHVVEDEGDRKVYEVAAASPDAPAR